jgi:FkbM family methyltransferase
MSILQRFILHVRARKYMQRTDRAEIAFLLDNLKPGQCSFDIGAHKGAYMYFMRKKVSDQGSVYVFEPQDALAKYLLKVKAAFGWTNVQVEHCAMSDSNEGGQLYVPHFKKEGSTTQLATISPGQNMDQFRAVGHVQTDTIDAYCERNHLHPDFLKIDVEGNELKVLKGARHILISNTVTLLVEIEQRHAGAAKVQETFDWMISLGYQGFLLHPSGHIPIALFDPATHQDSSNMKAYYNNFIFLKEHHTISVA